MLEDLDLSAIHEENARELIQRLLNLVEQLAADLSEAQAEIQRLHDENNHLRGEQGKPQVKGNVKARERQDRSSEKERQVRRQRHKRGKKVEIKVDREQVLRVDAEALPADAKFQGYKDVVVQDIVLKTDNVRFLEEKYYSPSQKKTYQARVPRGYAGGFGPGVKALVLLLGFGMDLGEPKIREFLQLGGVQISKGKISNLLIKKQDEFHAEKAAVHEAGLKSSFWQHIDDTLTRLNGQNWHCHGLCNPVYSSFMTLPKKDRLSVLDVLRNGRPRRFRLNQEALKLLNAVQLSNPIRQLLLKWSSDREWEEAAFLRELQERVPQANLTQRTAILSAAAAAAYHAETGWPIVQMLLCDDAPQFDWLARLSKCWVHDGRPYKKLMPVIPLHRQLRDDFLKRYWAYYHKLLQYKQHPTPEKSTRLEAEFESLFSTHTGYDLLDQGIAKTLAKKESLLWVLKYPELPLNNNPAELLARKRVRKRDTCFGPRTPEGCKAWDTFMSLADTARKLEVNFYDYLRDRITGINAIPPLVDLITKKAKELNLSPSLPPA